MINLDWLKTVYIIGAILLLIIAIAVYPTLREKAKKSHKK